VYGTLLPPPAAAPSIQAQASPDGMPGVIGIRSLILGGRGAAIEGTGVSPSATPGDILSRTPADLKYNRSVASGGSAQITALHTRGYDATTMSASAASSAGYTVLGGSDCSNLNTDVTPVTATKVFFNCAGGFTAVRAILPNATDVVFTGNVQVPNNQLLSMPNVSHVYVRGCTSSCSGGNNFGISIAGSCASTPGRRHDGAVLHHPIGPWRERHQHQLDGARLLRGTLRRHQPDPHVPDVRLPEPEHVAVRHQDAAVDRCGARVLPRGCQVHDDDPVPVERRRGRGDVRHRWRGHR
jgi:hypothetical protein